MVAYAEKHGRGWRARWRDADGKLRSASGFASRRDAETYGRNHEQGTPRYVVGTDYGELDTDPYEDETVNFYTVLAYARNKRDTRNAGFNGFYLGPGKTLIRAEPWKVYELVEVE